MLYFTAPPRISEEDVKGKNFVSLIIIVTVIPLLQVCVCLEPYLVVVNGRVFIIFVSWGCFLRELSLRRGKM